MSFNLDTWLDTHGLNKADPDADAVWGWVDLETTGLDPDTDVILEFGFIMTDAWGNVVEESEFHSPIRETSEQWRAKFGNMGDWCQATHEKSGLIDEIEHGPTVTLSQVQSRMLTLLREFDLSPRDIHWAGSSVHFDVGFMHHYLYDLEQFMHYRQANVSALKIMAQKLAPDLYGNMIASMSPFEAHRSMSDIGDSINEFRCYIDNFLWV